MRTHFRSTALPMRFARAVQYVFPQLNLSAGQEWAAEMFGYRDWHELVVSTQNPTDDATDLFAIPYVRDDMTGMRDGRPEEERLQRREPHARQRAEALLRLTSDMPASLHPTGAMETEGDIFEIARDGPPPAVSVRLGKGQPLYNALQSNWLVPEEHGVQCGELSDYKDIFTYEGFKTPAQLQRFAAGAGNPALADRLHTGEALFGRSDEPRAVVQTQTFRLWVSDASHRMTGGCEVSLTIYAEAAAPAADLFELCVSSAWHLPTQSAADDVAGALPTSVAFAFIDALKRFMRSRVGLPHPLGRIRVTHDATPYSAEVAEQAHQWFDDTGGNSTVIEAAGFEGSAYWLDDKVRLVQPRAFEVVHPTPKGAPS